MRLWQKMSLAFTAGAIGGAVNVAFVAIVAAVGIVALLGIHSPRPSMPAFLYKQMAWGGLWGLVLVLPLLRGKWWLRGLVLGFFTSLATMLYFLPRIQLPVGGRFESPGLFGLGWGEMMPLLILVANSVWGLTAAWWYARMTAD